MYGGEGFGYHGGGFRRGGYQRGRGRGYRGRGGGAGYHRPRVFRLEIFTKIEDLNELTLRLTSSLPEFEEFLKDSMSFDDIFDLLQILVKVCGNELHAGSIQKILRLVCESPFMDTHLLSLIHSLEYDTTYAEEGVGCILLLVSDICQKVPSYASKGLLLINELRGNRSILLVLRSRQSDHIAQLNSVKEECEKCMEAAQRQRRSRGRRGPHDDDETPPDDFKDLPVFPSIQDMDWTQDHFLRANKSEGAYRDQDHYLDVQFRLLREDYVQPLRNGIKEYQRLKSAGENMSKLQDVRLYFKVRILELVCDNNLEHRLQFDVTPFRNMRWQSSKQLIYGSLVGISPDDFKTIYFGVVTNRNVQDLQNGIIQVKFENCLPKILDMSGDEVFTMAESVTFFEAYRHVLSGMQELSRAGRHFPMSRYIVECVTDVAPPAYLRSRSGSNYMDLRHLLLHDNNNREHNVNVLQPRSWPTLTQTGFNQSQLNAVHTALTRALAIIQGPPGTGKTYVGLKIAKVLLNNRQVWNEPGASRPMLVVCYTNHALDQFLEGILNFLPEGIVRVGGQSKNPNLDALNLKKMREIKRKRKEVNLSIRNSIRDCLRERDGVREKLEKDASKLEATRRGIVGEHVLRSAMPPSHFTSLTARSRYQYFNQRPRSLMVEWLTSGALTVEKEEAEACARLTKEITAKILQGAGRRDETTVSPEGVLDLPFAERAKLYRFWVEKLLNSVKNNRPDDLHKWQVKTQSTVLEDSILKGVLYGTFFKVITSHIAKQEVKSVGLESKYRIRAWLGIPEFSQDRLELQKVLSQLEDTTAAPEEVLLNVDEEGTFLERQRHLDDRDEEDGRHRNRQRYTVQDAIYELGVDTTLASFTVDSTDDGFTISSSQRKKQARHLQHLLKTAEPMTTMEASRQTDLWSEGLNAKDRVRLYRYWLQSYQAELKANIKVDAERYRAESERLAELRFGEDCDILRQATVIGMTTTGAARYRKVLDNIGCPIVILEEAAEVLEAHVVTTLNQSCQHLILIGDHQQLRPSPTVYDLCREYHLDLSLFERLVNNKLHHITLAVQHRMRPEVSRLVRHVYPHLEDHVTTQNRDPINGFKENVFLLHHEIRETTQKDGNSKQNQHEAEFCVMLCKYLLQQGYDPDKITILAAYSGQVSVVRNLIWKYDTYFEGVRVTTIDNYQGEENDIIILSLVRCNEQGNVGFLGTDNRVCVALSRAKNGLYAFGNFKILAEKSDLWRNIVQTAKQHGQLGCELVLRCQNHPDVETPVTCANDFRKVPDGGCTLPCTFTYTDCGHACGRECHLQDQKHAQLKCKKPCKRVHSKCGHLCSKKCYEKCGVCIVKVQKRLAECKHMAMVECGLNYATERCKEPCERKLSCGHQCKALCGETCTKVCDEKVWKTRTDCKHKAMVGCGLNSTTERCKESCERKLSCGHQCKALCGETCTKVCNEKVMTRRSCGHRVMGQCSGYINHTPCKQLCGALLDCGHPCPATCGQCFEGRVHADCVETCGKPLSGCGHNCPLPCGTPVCLPCKQQWCKVSDSENHVLIRKTKLSLLELTHNAEAEKSFASAAAVAEMMKDLNTNRAFAVKNQIKLTRVTEMIKHLLHIGGLTNMNDDVQRLYAVLLIPVSTMSVQRCRELTEETTRLAYMAVLRFCQPMLSSQLRAKKAIDDYCSSVTESKNSFALSNAKTFVLVCQLNIPSWEEKVSAHIDLSILDAPADQHLYEIVKKTAKSDRTPSATSAAATTAHQMQPPRSAGSSGSSSAARVVATTAAVSPVRGYSSASAGASPLRAASTASPAAPTSRDPIRSSLSSRTSSTAAVPDRSWISQSSAVSTAAENSFYRLSQALRGTDSEEADCITRRLDSNYFRPSTAEATTERSRRPSSSNLFNYG